MCLVKVITHAQCGHTTDIRMRGCLLSSLTGKTCSPTHRLVAAATGFSTTTNNESQPYCRACYKIGVSSITSKYRTRVRDIVLDTWVLGMNVADVHDRLTALEMDEKAEVEQWAVECGGGRCDEERSRLNEEVTLCERCCFCCERCAAATRRAQLLSE